MMEINGNYYLGLLLWGLTKEIVYPLVTEMGEGSERSFGLRV